MSADMEMLDEPAPSIDPEAMGRVVNEEYVAHLVWLINTGMFPESLPVFQSELIEHLGKVMGEEGLPTNVH